MLENYELVTIVMRGNLVTISPVRSLYTCNALLEKINREEKTTLLVVTHNDVMVEYHPKRTIRIESGHIVNDGTRGELFYKQGLSGIRTNKEEEKKEEKEAVPEATIEMEAPVSKDKMTESEAQDHVINEITMQLDAIQQMKEGDRGE